MALIFISKFYRMKLNLMEEIKESECFRSYCLLCLHLVLEWTEMGIEFW